MEGLDQYLIVYLIANAIAIIILVTAWKNTRNARILFALLFIWAACTNMYTGLTQPDVYLEYAKMALPFYRKFIYGWFSHYSYIMVPLIAAGQYLIGFGVLLKGWWVKWACIGAIIFLLAITPLMVGSGFPFPLIVGWAAWLILKNDDKDYLWHKMQVPRSTVSNRIL
jgi:hypothetical protein